VISRATVISRVTVISRATVISRVTAISRATAIARASLGRTTLKPAATRDTDRGGEKIRRCVGALMKIGQIR
jgi:hypothetical protein